MRQRAAERDTLPPAVALLIDATAWLIGIPLAVGSRYDFDPPHSALRGAAFLALCAVAVQALIGHRRFLYRGRYASGTFDEVRAVCAAVAITAATTLLFDLLPPVRPIPASGPLLGGVLALVVMLGGRYAYRLRHEVQLRADRVNGN